MIKHPERASRIDYPVDTHWRLAVYEEPDDIVIRVDHSNPSERAGKWHDIARFEQSGHAQYHVHLPKSDESIEIAGPDTGNFVTYSEQAPV